MTNSPEALDNALYSYALSELHATSWLHVVYGEVTQLRGARLVIAPGSVEQGITPPQDKVCKEYLTELEAFPREATGLAIVNFSIKEHERPPACGGLAVIGAQRVIGKKDHSGRSGPIWKHAVFTSAGPDKRAPIQLDPTTLSQVASRLKECLSAKDGNGRVSLADEFSRFQDAADATSAEKVLLEHLRRLDHLPEAPSDVPLPSFRVRRQEGDEQRGVLYIRYDDRHLTLEQIIPQAAKVAAILYYSDFPWLAVELQCDDRQRERGSLPGWVVRFVGKDAQVKNSSGRIETFERLFNTERPDREEESLSTLAGRFFATLGGQLEQTGRDASQPYPSRVSPTWAMNERGPQTILNSPSISPMGKPPTTDKLTQGVPERRPLSDFVTEYRNKSGSTPTEHISVSPRTGDLRSQSSAPTTASSLRMPEVPVDSALSDFVSTVLRPPILPSHEEHLGQAIATNRSPSVIGNRPLLGFIPERVKLAVTLIWAIVVFVAALLSLLERAKKEVTPLQSGSSAGRTSLPQEQDPAAPVEPSAPKANVGQNQPGSSGGSPVSEESKGSDFSKPANKKDDPNAKKNNGGTKKTAAKPTPASSPVEAVPPSVTPPSAPQKPNNGAKSYVFDSDVQTNKLSFGAKGTK